MSHGLKPSKMPNNNNNNEGKESLANEKGDGCNDEL